MKKKVFFKSASIILLLIGLGSCYLLSDRNYQELETVSDVKLVKYAGKWYEIASFPQRFQEGCSCTTAEYSIKDNYVEVLNKCLKNGSLSSILGKAFPVSGSNNTKLKVQFFWPFKGDYWVIELDNDYEYAVVGTPDRQYLWILAREPIMEATLYNELLRKISAKGFDISRLKKTVQNCN